MTKLYTVKEVADMLRLTPVSIYIKIKNGKIPYVRIGRSIRFSEDNIKDIIKSEEK